LKAAEIRVEVDDRNEKMQAKIRDAQLRQIPYMLVVGEREALERTVAVRHRRDEDLGPMALEQFLARVEQESIVHSP
jgi:threonyl-tRNA synthetase